jgi:hypothetical protein
MGTRRPASAARGALVSQGSGGSSGPSFLSAAERRVGSRRVRRVSRSPMPQVLSREAGPRPSLAPGMYFRVMLVGLFEGIESERGIAWRAAESLCLREFLQIGLDERTPDHVTISRTRRLMDEATFRVFSSSSTATFAARISISGRRANIALPPSTTSTRFLSRNCRRMVSSRVRWLRPALATFRPGSSTR